MKQWMGRGLLLALVAMLVPACGGSGGGGGGGASVPNFVIPGAGGFTISATGGTSTLAATAGGTGGGININAQSGSQLNMLTGAFTVASTFTVPPQFNFNAATLTGTPPAGFNFGANVLTAATGTLNPPASGLGNVPGNVAAANATGLYVPPGVTLTINGNGAVVGGGATLTFPNGVLNAGTIILSKSAVNNNSGNLSLQCGEFINAVGGVIDATGAVGTAGVPQGGDGGFIVIQGPQANPTGGNLVNLGTIDISGGDTAQASNGGAAGFGVFLQANVSCYHTGILKANGGNATGPASTFGGSSNFAGNSVLMTNFNGNTPGVAGCFVSGTISHVGGNGRTNGGAGGRVFIGNAFAAHTGRIQVNGTINSSGGNAGAGGGSGGNGGRINIANSGQPVVSSATLTNNGGNGAGGGAGQNGGAGGIIVVSSDNLVGENQTTQSAIDYGGVAVSGNISANGGGGSAAGNGGPITIQGTNLNSPAGVNPMNLVGYSSIINSGGNGTIGGLSNNMTVRNSVHTDAQGKFTVGGVRNTIPITERGGNGSAGAGGAGGLLNIGTNLVGLYLFIAGAPLAQISTDVKTREVANEAAINLSGGTGTTTGGNSGGVLFQDYWECSNSGAITAQGGAGTAGAGGVGGTVWVASDNISLNSGAVDLSGGAGTVGGAGGTMLVHANRDVGLNATLTSNATNSSTGTVNVNGGNGSAGNGGAGGSITVTGNNIVKNDAACTANGGTGAGAGANGGAGGALVVVTTTANYTAGANAINTGSLTANGGNGAAAGGAGGALQVSGHAKGTNSGGLTATGGTGGTGNGGAGGRVVVSADASATSTGNHVLSGGLTVAGAGFFGGTGGSCSVIGQKSSHSGNVTANGGAAGAGGTGGNGGYLLVSSTVGSSTLHGTMSMQAGGPAGTTAIIGNVWRDGVDLSLAGPPVGTGTF